MAVAVQLPVVPNWNQVRDNINSLIDTLRTVEQQLVAAGPRDIQQPHQRQFNPKPELWRDVFTPSKEKRERLIKVLFSIFLRTEVELDTFDYISRLGKEDGPTFADKLKLRLPESVYSSITTEAREFDEGKLSTLTSTRPSATFFKSLINGIKKPQVWFTSVTNDYGAENWDWGGESAKLQMYMYRINTGIEWSECTIGNSGISRENLTLFDLPAENQNHYGALCLIQPSITGSSDSVINLNSIALILAQTGIWTSQDARGDAEQQEHYSNHLASITCFLGIFAGFWPSRIERSKFSTRVGNIREARHHSLPCHYVQIHFRCFGPIKSQSNVRKDGLLCSRQRGEIESSHGTKVEFEERRISIFGLLSNSPTDLSKSYPSMYRVTILADKSIEFSLSRVNDKKLMWSPGLEGSIVFQTAILVALGVWEIEWNIILDQIDQCLKFEASQTIGREAIKTWMFDDDFELSSVYFKILQTLRIFEECIQTVSADLRALDGLFRSPPNGFPQPNLKEDERLALQSNWEETIQHQKSAEQRLIERISNKTDEVKSLREGLFNASSLREANRSLREANRSTTLNYFVIIFTVVTVFYLPPSFSTALFAMPILQSGEETKKNYAITTVILSSCTYLAVIVITLFAWKSRKDDQRKTKANGSTSLTNSPESPYQVQSMPTEPAGNSIV